MYSIESQVFSYKKFIEEYNLQNMYNFSSNTGMIVKCCIIFAGNVYDEDMLRFF